VGQESGVGPVPLQLHAGSPVGDGGSSANSGARWILLALTLDDNDKSVVNQCT